MMPPFRLLVGLLLVLGAAAVLAGAAVQLSRGRRLFGRSGGPVPDVPDLRRRSAAALVEAAGVLLLAIGLLAHHRLLVWAGALVTAAGAVLMSFARRGLSRR